MPAVPKADLRPVVAITMGDPAGIGPEVVALAFAARGAAAGARRVVFGDARVMKRAVAVTGAALTIRPIRSPREGHFGPSELEVVDLANADPAVFEAGRVSAVCGRASWEYVEAASRAALAGEVDAVVTAPINKESIAAARLPYVGHTEMLAAVTGVRDPLTMFQTGGLRVFFLTRHIPLSEVSASLTRENVSRAIAKCIRFLKQLGIRNPKLAVAALNPHAGENGMFGREETEILLPAVEQSRKQGCRAFGPIPADSVFHIANEGRYDGVLSLYHDQGHIAAKTLDFRRTVSLTMGLPFLRTSVDHGTAFDIAGRGIADETSMLVAIRAAGLYARSVRRKA